MSDGVIQNPQYGESFQAVADILQLSGQAEQAREQRQAAEAILSALTSGNPDALGAAMTAAANFQATYSGGLGGVLQRIGATNMPGSPKLGALGQLLPFVKAQREGIDQTGTRALNAARTAESTARTKTYGVAPPETARDIAAELATHSARISRLSQIENRTLDEDQELAEAKEDQKRAREAYRRVRGSAAAATGTPGATAAAAPSRVVQTFNQFTGEEEVNRQPTGRRAAMPGAPGSVAPEGLEDVWDTMNAEEQETATQYLSNTSGMDREGRIAMIRQRL